MFSAAIASVCVMVKDIEGQRKFIMIGIVVRKHNED